MQHTFRVSYFDDLINVSRDFHETDSVITKLWEPSTPLLYYHAWMWACLEFSRVNLWRPFEFSQIGEPWTRLTIFPSRVSPCTGWKSVTISFLLMNLWSRTLRNWGRYNVSGQNHSDCRWNDTVGLGVCNIWKEHVFLSKFESFE